MSGIPFGIKVILLGLAFLGVKLLLFFFFKKGEEDEGQRGPGRFVARILIGAILLGLWAGVYQLSHLPFNKKGAVDLESTTELSLSATGLEDLDYNLHKFRGALVVDIWSLRVVIPDRMPQSMFPGEVGRWGKIVRGSGDWAGGTSNLPLETSVVSVDWGGDNVGGVVSVTIDDDVSFTIADGIATIDGVEVPARGPMQVVFLDPLGGFDEVISTVLEESPVRN